MVKVGEMDILGKAVVSPMESGRSEERFGPEGDTQSIYKGDV